MSKARRTGGFRWLRVSAGLVGLAIVAIAWWAISPSPSRQGSAPPQTTPFAAPASASHEALGVGLPLGAERCGEGLADAARQNQASLDTLAFAPFHRPETGWATYAPLIASAIGTGCAATSPAFAGRLAAWQSVHGLSASGALDAATFDALKAAWQARRPFVAASARGCPDPPPEYSLARVPAQDSYGGKTLLLRPAALAAYERMLAAARAEEPAIKAQPALLTLFSAYRSPAADAARCALENNCQNLVRTTCSAHLTGLAIDLNLGAAPGFSPDSSDDTNRRHIAEGPAYRWLAANASRFGFTAYAFEPWHWEWTGEGV